MLSERRRSLLVFNGIGLIATAILSGWFYFFFLLGAIDLWPFVTDVPVNIGGDQRAWNMAHLEGITNGTMLIAIGAAGSYIRLGERAQAVLFWASLAFGYVTINNVIFLFGWPAMVGVHLAVALLLWGAWQHHRHGAGQ